MAMIAEEAASVSQGMQVILAGEMAWLLPKEIFQVSRI
jgi:hypothetical protein